MAMGVRGAIASAVGLVLLVVTASSAGADGMLTGDIPTTASGGGVALVHWTGGSIDDLQDAAAEKGCSLRSVWLTVGGKLVGYFVGAPPFVNVDWLTLVGAPEVDDGPLLIRCTTPVLGSCMESMTTFDHPVGTVGFATAEEAVRVGVATLPDPPKGRLVTIGGLEVDGSSGLEKEEWALLTAEGFSVGRFVAMRQDLGWLLSTARVCVFT
jgi:hypothetical protein